VFKTLAKNSIISQMEANNIKWVFICGIDNVLLKIVDPLFLGITIANNASISSKSIFKEDPYGTEWIFARINGRPGLLDSKRITPEMRFAADINGDFLYREANMLSHLMSIDTVRKASALELPYHRAFKKSTFLNSEGMKQVPEEPNSFKFEQFIFDVFPHFDDLLLLRVGKDEFAPIKDLYGIYSPEVATRLYVKNNMASA